MSEAPPTHSFPPPDDFTLNMREFEEGDANFILRTWLRGYRNRIHSIPDPLYYEQQQKLIRKIAQRSRIAIASTLQDPTFIMSFSIAEPLEDGDDDEPLRLHYCFTKLTYRRMGLATATLRQLGWNDRRPIHLSHWNYSCRALERDPKFDLVYNPYLLMDLPNAHKLASATDRARPVQDAPDVPVGESDGPGTGG